MTLIETLDPFDLDLEKITLIEASAGTGKTYTITTLVARLLARGFPIESILVVTFTEAAAAELKLRIRRRLALCLAQDSWGSPREKPDTSQVDELVRFFSIQPDPGLIRRRLAHALTCFDQACIMTIHAFCFQTLKENAFESGSYFDRELLTDSSGFFDQVCMDFFMTRINDQDSLFLKFLARKGVTPESFKADFRQGVSRPGLDIIPPEAEFQEVSDLYRALTRKIHDLLITRKQEIMGVIQAHKGVDKRSYSQKYLPIWLDQSLEMLETQGPDCLFDMGEKGDSLYKFTRTRIADKTRGPAPVHEFFDLCEQLLETSRVMETNVISLKLEFFSFFHRELEKLKQIQGVCFFDDLINDLAAALEGEGREQLQTAVKKKYQACLIDEFQDTDPAQYGIFSCLFAGSNPDSDPRSGQPPFFMIGDPKQAIYAFRGGDIFAYLMASQACDQKFTLDKNYRSAPLLVQAVNDIFSLEVTPFLFEGIEFTRIKTPESAVNRLVENNAALPPLEFVLVERTDFSLDRQGYIKKEDALKRMPGILAADLLALLNSNKGLQIRPGKEKTGSLTARAITPGDMAVLVRTNQQAQGVHQALSDLNIPSYLSKTGSVFDSQEAIELYDILAAVYEPDQIGLIKAALASSVFEFTGTELADLDRDEKGMWLWQDRFRGFKTRWEQQGFVTMIMGLFHSHEGILKPASRLSERGLTNFYHLIELVSQAGQRLYLSMFYLLKWVEGQLTPATREETADELRLESDKRAVAIVTIHKSKGLEYPIVFLPYLWSGSRPGQGRGPLLFHDPEMDFRLRMDLRPANPDPNPDLNLDLNLDPNRDQARSRQLMAQEERAEERRLLYVALTRASAHCRIIWAGISSVEASALGSLVHPGGCQDDAGMIQDLERLCRPGENQVEIRLLDPGQAAGIYGPRDLPRTDLEPRSWKRQILPAWRISSFTGLIASRTGADSLFRNPPEVLDRSDLGDPSNLGDRSNPGICLKDFPKGAGAGDFFHAVFETLDFRDPAAVKPLVEVNLAKFGFMDFSLVEPAVTAVKQVLATCLETENQEGFCLQEIARSQCLTELEFMFDVEGFDLPALAALFAGEPWGHAYARQLSTLGTGGLKGFVKGFIDLVICHQGKWYILDYKSNFLGPAYEDYGKAAMQEAMESHHYILQYHLYLVALHRYLGLRKKNYDYGRDFGGVFYLFIRGMHPDAPRGQGVFSHCPSHDFLHRFLAIL